MSKQFTSPYIIGTMRIGAWGSQMSTSDMEEFIEECLAIGFSDFDHADIYGHYTTASDFGKVLKLRPELRAEMKIIDKCGIKLISDNRPQNTIKSYDLTKIHIKHSVEQSLKNLNTEYIDTLLLHRPDYLMNVDEIAEIFMELKNEGKVNYFGVSNFSVSQFELLNAATPLTTNQVEISILQRDVFENGILDQCQKLKITPLAWSPLGGGELFKVNPDKKIAEIKLIANKLAKKYHVEMDQILYAWIRKHPSKIIPVLGTSKISRIKAAYESLNVDISNEEWYMLWQAAIGNEVA
jgi:predicted oxidoreductase